MPDDIARLKIARDKAHDKLSEAEYAFTLADRALEKAKREQLAPPPSK